MTPRDHRQATFCPESRRLDQLFITDIKHAAILFSSQKKKKKKKRYAKLLKRIFLCSFFKYEHRSSQSLAGTNLNFFSFLNKILNVLPNGFWNHQSKWISLTQVIVRVQVSYPPKVIWQCEWTVFDHILWRSRWTFSEKPKIFIKQSFLWICVTEFGRPTCKSIKIPYSLWIVTPQQCIN